MPRLYQLRDLLAEILALHDFAAARHCKKLQDAGLLPRSTAATVEAEHAAIFLIAAMAARAPSETVEAANVYGPLDLLCVEFRQRLDDGSEIANPPQRVPDDLPEQWRSLQGVVADVLFSELPFEMNLRRNLVAPSAFVCLSADPAEPTVTKIVRLTYGRRQPPAGLLTAIQSLVTGSLEVWAGLPDSAMRRIGAFLAGKGSQRAAEMKPQTALLH